MDHGGSAGPTRSSGSCGSWPGRSPPSRAWSAGPAGSRRRTVDSSRRGDGCRRTHGKPCWPMRSIPRESTPASSPHPRTTRMSSDACGRPSKRRGGKEGAYGTSPQAQPHPRTPPRHPTSTDARMPAAPTLPRPAAPREPRAPHNMTRLTPRPAAPPPHPMGGLLPGPRPGHTPTTLLATTGHLTQQPRLQAANQPARLATGHREPPRPAPAPTKPDHARGTQPASDSAPSRRPNRPGADSARRPRPASPPAVTHSLPATPPGTATEQHAEPRPE